uniref:Virulence plasmid B protein n=1 Tax=Candidatus Kentrum sp. TC TaxID=2126339 RepID=A0A450Z431_9GAMM|nr:MAG: virulence plasmid B protein [Candidatus Kentron sp. TC]
MSIRSVFRYVTALALFAVIFSGAHAKKLVGSIPGQLGVEQGAAIYTIPIKVPPGAAGMRPDLAITYNSNGGNGLLGVGFSLSGLSTITRCGKTIAQDGAWGGVYYDSRDRFCLNGQRLIAISGADGGNGAEYRTEIDGYSRIIILWATGQRSGMVEGVDESGSGGGIRQDGGFPHRGPGEIDGKVVGGESDRGYGGKWDRFRILRESWDGGILSDADRICRGKGEVWVYIAE